MAIQIGLPCLIDDSKFPYDRGHLSKYFNNSKICQSAEIKNERVPFISITPPPNVIKFSLLNIPSEVKRSLEFCHEDPTAWYRGVILKHMFKTNKFTIEAQKKILQTGSVSNIIKTLSKKSGKMARVRSFKKG